jgi:uncharacterized membrane protein YgcG
LVLSFCAIAHAVDFISVPTQQGWVTDLANVFSSQDRERLSKMLAAYEDETQHQLAVLIIPTLSGEPIDSSRMKWCSEKQGLTVRLTPAARGG